MCHCSYDFQRGKQNVRGNHQLKISVTDSQGKVMEVGTYETEAAGGEVYGQLLEQQILWHSPTSHL